MEALLLAVSPAEVSAGTVVGLVALSFVTSMLTAALGLGGGLLLVAVMASVVPPAALIPVHGVVQLGSNLGRAILFRRYLRAPILGWFAVGAVAGVSLGAVVAVQIPQSLLLLVIAVFVLGSTWLPALARRRVADRGFLAVGIASAFVTMFVGATGPFLAPFLSPERTGDRHASIATFAACMTLKHGLKVAAFAMVGFAFADWLPLAAMMIASGFLGTLTGRVIVDRVSEARFRIAFRILLTVLAFRLVYQAAAG